MPFHYKKARLWVFLLTGMTVLVPPSARAQAEHAETPSPAPALSLESWDDDWVYPEGRIRIGGSRFSLVVGGIMTRFAGDTARERFGSRQFDPDLDLYAPQRKGRSPDLDLSWTGLVKSGLTARIIAPTLGLRSVFVEPTSRKPLVPFAAFRVGPYFVKTTDLGGHTVLGANATVGVEINRQVSVALRYDLLRKVEGLNLSNWSVSLLLKVPQGTPAGAAQKMHGALSPPGDLVDVGGYRLHLVCRGEGTPTVVLDAGMSDAWVTWSKVQPALAKTTRVCSFDRAGIGFSEPGPSPRTSSQIVKELHTLLGKAGVGPPYVLVGHSFGGYNVRLFASRHPTEVVGIVLVDASHEDQWRRYPAEVRGEVARMLGRSQQMAEKAERGERMAPIVPNLPPALASRPCWYRTLFEELRSVEMSADELRAADRSLHVPLVVISAGRSRPMGRTRRQREEMSRAWEEMQTEMVALSPYGKRIIARNSSHYVQRDEPEVVVAAIEEVLTGLRRAAASPGAPPTP